MELVGVLLDAGYRVIARPHPMTYRHSADAIEALRSTYADHPRFELDEDVASQDSLHRSHVMVSDWSGAALEYAFAMERPVLFVDVERKVLNPDYEQLGIEPFEAAVREQIGRVVSPAALADAPRLAAELIDDASPFVEAIRAARDTNIANIGTSGKVAAELIAAKADAIGGRSAR
jgi:YidC/Oxa1 family membrane protein insertase